MHTSRYRDAELLDNPDEHQNQPPNMVASREVVERHAWIGTHAMQCKHGSGHVSRACMLAYTRVLGREQETRQPSVRGDSSENALVLSGQHPSVLCWVSSTRSCDSIGHCSGEGAYNHCW